MATQNNTSSGWTGWAYFAGFMMMLVGAMEVISGLTAIFKSGVYLVDQSHLLVLNFKQWGWISLLLGIIIFFAGLELFRGATWARIVAIFLAGISFLANMAFVQTYPIWSVTMMVVDILIIYAVLIHGDELRANNN